MDVLEAFRGASIRLTIERAVEGAEVSRVVTPGRWAGAVVA